MAKKNSTQATNTRGNVVAMPMRTGPSINVEKLLLEGQSTPKVLVPKDLQDAIDRRARALSQQAYTLCREHLQRRIAYRCEFGHPVRQLDIDKAFALIAQGDLGDALLHEYTSKLKEIQFAANMAVRLSAEFKDALASAAA